MVLVILVSREAPVAKSQEVEMDDSEEEEDMEEGDEDEDVLSLPFLGIPYFP